MRLHRLPAALALVIALACSALPAEAQITEGQAASPVTAGTWSITPFLSLTFGGDSDSTSLGFGGAAGYDFTGRLGLEVEAGYVFDLAGDDAEADWSLINGGASLLYHVPLDNGMAPYGAFGVGFGRSSLTIAGVGSRSTEVGFNFGGGIKAPLNDTLAVRGDVRYFKYSDAVPDGWRVYGGLTWKLRQ